MPDLSLPDTVDAIAKSMLAKARLSFGKAWVLAMLGGAYIALAGFGSTVVGANLLTAPETYGIGRCVSGLIFPVGLVMVVITGAELFTGNCLMVEALRQKLLKPTSMLRSWLLVYLGNFCGAILVTLLLYFSGIFASGQGVLATAAIRIAAAKSQLFPLNAFLLGIFCNWLVCLAIWMSSRCENVSQKILPLFLPIWLFVACGFEHSIANMYFLPAGWLTTLDPGLMSLSSVPLELADKISIAGIGQNLLFVTLGNIVGGSFLVACPYGFAYRQAGK